MFTITDNEILLIIWQFNDKNDKKKITYIKLCSAKELFWDEVISDLLQNSGAIFDFYIQEILIHY